MEPLIAVVINGPQCSCEGTVGMARQDTGDVSMQSKLIANAMQFAARLLVQVAPNLGGRGSSVADPDSPVAPSWLICNVLAVPGTSTTRVQVLRLHKYYCIGGVIFCAWGGVCATCGQGANAPAVPWGLTPIQTCCPMTCHAAGPQMVGRTRQRTAH